MGYSFGPPPIVRNGLVLHLDAANKRSYPGSGTTWYDLSGNGNNATLINMSATPLDSANGGSLTFDGSNDYVNLPNNDEIKLTTSTFSIGIFFKGGSLPTSFPGYVDILYTSRGSSASSGFSFVISNQPTVPFTVWIIDRQGTGGSLIAPTNTYRPNIWQYAVFTKHNSEGRLYVDGNLVDSNSTQPATYSSTTNPRLGRQILYNDYNFTGNMSQVSIYNRALTSQEILQNYNSIKGRFGL